MWKQCSCFLLGAVFFASCAMAQAPGVVKDTTRGTMKKGATMTSEQMAQHWQENLARCLLLSDQGQVLIGDFALERAQNPEVRQFAQAMVKNHNEWIAKLEPFVPDAPNTDALNKRVYAIFTELKSEKGTVPVTSETGETSRKAEVPALATNGSEKTTGMEAKHFMHMIPAMQQQMVENCVAYTQWEFSQLDKNQFDKAYIDWQIFSHINALAKLKTLQNFAPAKLKPIIESETTAVQSNLEQAKNICKQLQGKTAASARGGSY